MGKNIIRKPIFIFCMIFFVFNWACDNKQDVLDMEKLLSGRLRINFIKKKAIVIKDKNITPCLIANWGSWNAPKISLDSLSKLKTSGFDEVVVRDVCDNRVFFHFYPAIGYTKFSKISDTIFCFTGYPVFLKKELKYEKRFIQKKNETSYEVSAAIFTFPFTDSISAIKKFKKVQKEYPIFMVEKMKFEKNNPKSIAKDFYLPVEFYSELLMLAYFSGCVTCKNMYDSIPIICPNECGPPYYSQKQIIKIYEREERKQRRMIKRKTHN